MQGPAAAGSGLLGLDALDHRYLKCIAVNFGGGPVGIETIRASLSEPRDAIEEIIEPYLIQQGFVHRTPAWTGADAPGLQSYWPGRAGWA